MSSGMGVVPPPLPQVAAAIAATTVAVVDNVSVAAEAEAARVLEAARVAAEAARVWLVVLARLRSGPCQRGWSTAPHPRHHQSSRGGPSAAAGFCRLPP